MTREPNAGASRAFDLVVASGFLGLFAPVIVAVAAALTIQSRDSVFLARRLLVLVFGPAPLVLAPVLAVLAWTRVELRDHTPADVVTGLVAGATVAAAVLTRVP